MCPWHGQQTNTHSVNVTTSSLIGEKMHGTKTPTRIKNSNFSPLKTNKTTENICIRL